MRHDILGPKFGATLLSGAWDEAKSMAPPMSAKGAALAAALVGQSLLNRLAMRRKIGESSSALAGLDRLQTHG